MIFDNKEFRVFFNNAIQNAVLTFWVKSFFKKEPVDMDGKPIPWSSFSYVEFIRKRLNKDMDVFEFGCGNSTLFYSKFVNKIFAVEHDKRWYDVINKKIPENVVLYLKSLETGEYFDYLCELKRKFHIIVIDGRERIKCVKYSVRYLHNNGVIILDDSERKKYKKIFDFLRDKGFKELTFSGLTPLQTNIKSTTVFYKNKNCLDI